MSPPLNPFPSFSRLGPSIYLYTPTNPTSSTNTPIPPPGTILLFPWLNASPQHIHKYITAHQLLHPTSRILLLTTSTADFLWYSHATTQHRLALAITAILASPTYDEGVYVHAFSNGGASTLCNVAAAFRDAGTTRNGSGLLPMRALILDSAPGRAGLVASVDAFAVSLPKAWYSPTRILGLLALWAIILLFYFISHVLRLPNPIDIVRQQLNDPSLMRKDAGRMYIYSKEDKLVRWRDVQEHADEAERRGWRVKREVFRGSGHVGHARVEGQRYWGVVGALWEEEKG
ncbi:MAG: hypothetical protein M1827_000832 [Pycnora praestabilis]|nr:MAG: hypothetical protein M1827_000832 [Pycnora praestabilis]